MPEHNTLIRKIQKKDVKHLIPILVNAFPGVHATPERQEALKNYLKKILPRNPKADFYGYFRNNQILGAMCLFDFQMFYLEKFINLGGVGFVSVDLLHKKEKICKNLIEYFIKYYKSRGYSIVGLYPFRPDFYRKMGFGFGTKMEKYLIKPESFPKAYSKKHLVYLSKKDLKKMLDCYHRYLKQHHGLFKRDRFIYERIFSIPNIFILGYREGKQLKGYIIFSFENVEPKNPIHNNLVIREIIYEDYKVLQEFFSFLNSQADQINRVMLKTQDEYFHHNFWDPRNEMLEIIPPSNHPINVTGLGIMYRIIDLKGLFRDLKFRNFNRENIKLKIRLKDSFYPENEKPVIIHFKDGKPRIHPKGFDVEINLDVSDFSSLIMGVIPFEKLFNYGLVEISDNTYLQRLNNLFNLSSKPICMTAF